ncbi:MAG: PAS domain S-box protein [Thermodesulfobacteriota bacterium]
MKSDPERQQNIFAKQVEKAYEGLPASLSVNLVNSCVLVYVQWRVIAHLTLITWLSVLLLVSCGRLGSYLYKKKNTLISSQQWGFFYIGGLFLSGLIWGMAGIFLFPENDIAHQIIVAFILGGMIAGATASSAALPGAFYYYCIPAVVPILFKYYQLDDPVGHAMCFMIIVFVLFSVATYRHIHKIIFDLIDSGISNQQELNARRQAESKAKEHQSFLKTVLYNIKDGIVACDEKGLLTLFNRASSEFHGIPPQRIAPEKWASHYDLYLEDGTSPMPKEDIPLYKALQGVHVHNQEMCIIPKDGVKRVVLASGQPLVDDNGKKIGAVVSMHEITKEKKAQIDLQRAYDDLELKIKERTEELVEINRALRGEIEERKKAEKEIKTLEGILPLCSFCKKIRNEKDEWEEVDGYIYSHSQADISHGICPDCAKKHYPEFVKKEE